MQTPGICTAGHRFGEDAIFTDRATSDTGAKQQLDPAPADLAGLHGAAAIDEPMRAGRVESAGGAVVQVSGNAFADRYGQGNLAVVDLEPAGTDVDELEERTRLVHGPWKATRAVCNGDSCWRTDDISDTR
ncbi:hypothetical protein [Streptomyces galilaeus]|uniref:hypothetical protein n=1 Tax=Streptomyces galilaeus TaxID=33899 RepID=UPI0038F7C93D